MIFNAKDVHYPQSGTVAPFRLDSNLRYRVVGIDDDYHWLDRATNQPLTYKDGSKAQWSNLDEAIDAFIEGKLTVERNEVMG